jgi:hypothetical protein
MLLPKVTFNQNTGKKICWLLSGYSCAPNYISSFLNLGGQHHRNIQQSGNPHNFKLQNQMSTKQSNMSFKVLRTFRRSFERNPNFLEKKDGLLPNAYLFLADIMRKTFYDFERDVSLLAM